MISKKLADIAAEDLHHLVENIVQERKTLEYKAALPDNSDGDKKEFLADVSSLANTEGGDLVFGLKETGGVLQSDIGLTIANSDTEIARLENIVRDGIFSRIGLEMRAVDVGSGKKVIIVRTKASLDAPHRVIFKGHDKFYKRNSNGKYAMDVGELRSTFLQSGELIERIRRFRISRIADIKAGETPVPIPDPSTFSAVHILPLTAFTTSFRIAPKLLLELKEGKHPSLFRPPRGSGWNHRINLEGAVAYAPDRNGATLTYTQLYGDGKIEALDDLTLPRRTQTEAKVLPMGTIEVGTMQYTARMLQLLASFDFQPPFYIFLSLVGVEGCTVSAPAGHHFFDSERERITQKELLLPEVIIENTSDDLPRKFQQVFDMIWNAAGISRSLHYDQNGNYKDQQWEHSPL